MSCNNYKIFFSVILLLFLNNVHCTKLLLGLLGQDQNENNNNKPLFNTVGKLLPSLDLGLGLFGNRKNSQGNEQQYPMMHGGMTGGTFDSYGGYPQMGPPYGRGPPHGGHGGYGGPPYGGHGGYGGPPYGGYGGPPGHQYHPQHGQGHGSGNFYNKKQPYPYHPGNGQQPFYPSNQMGGNGHRQQPFYPSGGYQPEYTTLPNQLFQPNNQYNPNVIPSNQQEQQYPNRKPITNVNSNNEKPYTFSDSNRPTSTSTTTVPATTQQLDYEIDIRFGDNKNKTMANLNRTELLSTTSSANIERSGKAGVSLNEDSEDSETDKIAFPSN